MTRCGGWRGPTASCGPRDMAEKTSTGRKKRKPNERGGKLSFYGLSIEDALGAAAKTGRPTPLAPNRNRPRKKRAPSAPATKE
jgi:hypothetical protein